jgi:hypothetical protein
MVALLNSISVDTNVQDVSPLETGTQSRHYNAQNTSNVQLPMHDATYRPNPHSYHLAPNKKAPGSVWAIRFSKIRSVLSAGNTMSKTVK